MCQGWVEDMDYKVVQGQFCVCHGNVLGLDGGADYDCVHFATLLKLYIEKSDFCYM